MLGFFNTRFFPFVGTLFLVIIMIVFALRNTQLSLFPLVDNPWLYVQLSLDSEDGFSYYQYKGQEFENSLYKQNSVMNVLADYQSNQVTYFIEFKQGVNLNESKALVRSELSKLGMDTHSRNMRIEEDVNKTYEFVIFADKNRFSDRSYTEKLIHLDKQLRSQPDIISVKITGLPEQEAIIEIDHLPSHMAINISGKLANLSNTLMQDKRLGNDPQNFDYIVNRFNAFTQLFHASADNYWIMDTLNFFIRDRQEKSLVWSDNKFYNGFLISFSKTANPQRVKKNLDKVFSQFYSTEEYTYIVDPSVYIEDAKESVFSTLWQAMLVLGIVLYLLTRSISVTFIVAFPVMLTCLLTSYILFVMSMTLNLILLCAIVLCIGISVDISIVIFNQIRLSKNINSPASIKTALIASVVTNVATFVPLLLFQSKEIQLFSGMILVFTLFCVLSFFIAFVLMPPILIKVIKFQASESLQAWVDTVHKRLVLNPISIYVVLIMAALCLIYISLGKFSFSFYEEIDRGPLVFYFNIPEYQLQNDYLFKINKEIHNLPEFSGSQNFYVIQSGSNFSILFPNKDNNFKANKAAIKKSIKNALGQPALEISDRLWIPTDFKNSDPPEVVVSFYDEAYEHFDQIVNMANEMSKQQAFGNVYAVPNFVSRMAGTFDVSTLSKSYASIEQIRDLQALSLLLYGKQYYGEILQDGKSLPLYSIPKANVGINAQWIKFNGVDLPLRYFVDYQETERPYFFWSKNGRKRMTIRIHSVNHLGSFREKSDYVDHWIKKSGYLGPYEIENGKLQIENTLIDLCLAALMSIGMIFLVTWWYFNNIKESLIMMLALACCTVLTLTCYLLFHSSISIATGMGILLLMGLGINNLYLIANAINKGVDLKLVIRSRVPSILITNLTTVVCAIPLAFSTGVGSILLKPIAEILVIGSGVFVVFSIFIFPGLVLMFSNQAVSQQTNESQVNQGSDQNLAA